MKSNFIINRVISILLFVSISVPYASCIENKIQVIRNSAARSKSFDYFCMLNDYYSYYWSFPQNIDSLLVFCNNYSEYYWIPYSEFKYSTWLTTYKKVNKNKTNYDIFLIDNSCVFINYKKRVSIAVSHNICLDLKDISSFKRLYRWSAFDKDNKLLFLESDSLYYLEKDIISLITKEYAYPCSLYAYYYSCSNGALTPFCSSNVGIIEETMSDKLKLIIKSFCRRFPSIETIQLYIPVSLHDIQM